MHPIAHRAARTLALAGLLAVPAALGFSAFAGPQAPPSAAEKKETVKLPETPLEHLAMSDEYKKKAATYRDESAFHRKMLADYKAQVRPDPRQAFENAYVRKMRIHCEGYIKDADALAADAEKFAEFHRLRAAELQGK